MGDVIDLNKRRKKKTGDNPVVDTIRDSLDNDAVMRRYGITPQKPKPISPTEEERLANIRASIDRVNKLMGELHDNVNKGTPK
jgi:hypothetical protein